MQLGDATSSPDSGFSWGNILTTIGSAVGSAVASLPSTALQYKTLQLQAQTQQAQIAAQTAQAQAAAQAQLLARYNTVLPGTKLPSLLPGQAGYGQVIPATTNYLPMILIGVFGLGAVLLMSRR